MEVERRMDLNEYDYPLPSELIAQHPADRRDQSRLLIVDRAEDALHESRFADIGQWLREGDVLAINDTRVIPARLFGVKEPGGARIEMLLLKPLEPGEWDVIAYRASRLKPGVKVVFSDGFSCEVIEPLGDGRFRVAFDWQGDWSEALARHGQVPLPPYIERKDGAFSDEDRERYQTIYARERENLNSAAAPTAGLHFTPELLESLRSKGVQTASLTLQVGLDTFLPMRVDRVEDHVMHSECYDVPAESAQIINAALDEGRRVIAVGTTSARTLEAAGETGRVAAGPGATSIYIYPGYRFRIVKAMITNFHLPRSTLLLMISALMGDELRKRAYEYAVEQRYRFYSYGDAMLIV